MVKLYILYRVIYNEPEVVNTGCIRCSPVLDLPKATVTHALAQGLGETFSIWCDAGIDGCVTIGHDCGSSLSDLPNVGSMIQSHNSSISLCGSGRGPV